ncbi:hypothetical protein GGR52DRAFT_172565 [Hypoxylon sp. FL1284]|nr:hypothetical protein GGR52DRAFT_172565 [Hypoxylon sp. FL1284]
MDLDLGRLKQLEEAEEELRRRRERGKLAQRAFRKRQAKASQDKRGEAQQLKAAIGDIVRVACSDDRPELLRAVAEAARVAGFDTRRAADDSSEQDREQIPKSPSSLLPLSSNTRSANEALRNRTGSGTEILQGPTSSDSGWELGGQMAAVMKPRAILGNISPRADYGLWFDTTRYVRMDDPPLEIIPYLGKGKSTFAGHVFWACGEYMLSLCRIVDSNAHTNPQVAREATEKVWSMVQHSPPLHNLRYVRALAEARAEFRERGYVVGDNPAGEVDSGKIIQELVAADYKSRGEDPSGWMATPDLESYLRRRLSQESYGHLESVLGLMDANQPDCPLSELVRSLIQELAESFICFGDGPRWNAARVSAIFSRKIQNRYGEISGQSAM